MKRIFIAINLPKEIKESLADLEKELSSFDLPVRWVKPDNIHLTLVFLGYMKESEVVKVTEVTKEIVDKFKPFDLEIKDLGCFPNLRNPRVIWIGLKDNKNLINLQSKLALNLKEAGFRFEEREWQAHLTLGRAKEKIGDIEGIFEKLGEINLGEFKVKSIEIMESKLAPKGAEYNIVESLKLKVQS